TTYTYTLSLHDALPIFLDQIYAISDRLTVLRNGKYEGEYLTRDLDRHALISKMIGKDLDALKSLGGNRRTTPRDADEAPLLSARSEEHTSELQSRENLV